MQDHVNSFVNSVEGDHTGNPNFQLVRINLQENYLKSLIVNMFVSNLRRVVPRDQHEKYLVSSQNMEMLRECVCVFSNYLVYRADKNSKTDGHAQQVMWLRVSGRLEEQGAMGRGGFR